MNTKEKRMLSSPKIKAYSIELYVLTAFLSANNFIIFTYNNVYTTHCVTNIWQIYLELKIFDLTHKPSESLYFD